MAEKRTKNKITYQTILDFCKQKGWETLETEYINTHSPMKWRCKTCSYEWTCGYNNTRNKISCSKCAGSRIKHTQESVEKIVNLKGITLIEPYTRSDYVLTWKCLTCDYIFKTSFSNINRERRSGCPSCNGQPTYTIERVREICLEKQLTCLEESYIDCNTHMLFKCNECLREWSTSFRSICQNIGCIRCTIRHTICLGLDFVKETIKDRNMECLDTEYKTTHDNMNWKCLICFKSWQATFTHIKDSNSGCPNCSVYKSQRMCRKYFEMYMGLEFPTKRPKFLQGLEYDGYCKELKLAFEYQGLQHEQYIPHFHRKENAFEKQQERDSRKELLSKEHGITLIKIPAKYSHKKEKQMADFIWEELLRTKVVALHDTVEVREEDE
jgi:hypothetical protein